MDHASGTVVLSKALKSISSETLVQKDFCSRGYQTLAVRQKIKGCEIDLIFYDSLGGLVFVEVKAGDYERVIERWLQSDQRLRQRKTVGLCLERGFEVSWMLSIVNRGQIRHWNLLD